jgi:hypothetical protein
MAPRSRQQHIPRDNERTRLKTEQAKDTDTQRRVGKGGEENWILERDRLLAIIRDRKEDLLKRRQAKQAEKERLEKEELDKQRLEKVRLEKERQEQQRQKDLAASQKRRFGEIAQQAARLLCWQQWARRYQENLAAEGFTLFNEVWRKPINPDDRDYIATFKDAKAKKLSDIPSNFPHDLESSAYTYVSWDKIRYEHDWYSQREENLLDLGFEAKIGWAFSLLSTYWRGFFFSQVPNFVNAVWGWPGANYEEYLPCILPPEDLSPYQILDLASCDKALLNGTKEKQYRKNLDRLPSAQLGNPRDPLLQWMRQFSEVEIHHNFKKNVRPLPTQPLDVPQHLTIQRFATYSSWVGDYRSLRMKFLSLPRQIPPLARRPTRRAIWHGLIGCSHFISKCLEVPANFLLLNQSLEPKSPEGFYDYRHMNTLLEKLERFRRLCLRGSSWLDNVLPYRWSRRAARYNSWDWNPPPQSSPQYTYEVPGLLNGQPSNAFPDTGSDQNLLSRDYVRRNNIPIVPDGDGTTHIKSADGRVIPTTGTAQLAWSFYDSPYEKHMLDFHVLEQCVHDILLGHPFLLETNTTTLNRIKRYTVNAMSSNSAGAVYDIHAASGLRPGQCTTDGHLAGEAIKTLADTGAQVNIMSLAYAQARNFKLDITGNRGTFRFIDGSEAPSIATVNAVWISSDKKKYSLKFEVLIGSSYDVILGQKHIYGTKALLGKKSDPSSTPNSSQATTPLTLDPLPAEPRRTPPASRSLEGPITKPPDANMGKPSNVCAVGFKSPFAKASKAAKRLLSKTKKNENLPPHLSSQAQEEIDRRATEESRHFQNTHSDSSPPSASRDASRNSSESTAVASTWNDSASTGISTTTESEAMPPSDTIAVEDLNQEDQVENAYTPYLYVTHSHPVSLFYFSRNKILM